MIWRVVENADRKACAKLVARWYYFRAVTDREIADSTWFAAELEGDRVGLLWFTEGPEPDSLSAHACTDPMARGRLSDPDTMRAVELIAGLLGADRVYSVLEGAEGLRVGVVKRWLRSRGWRDHELGMVREIGG